MVVLKQDKNQSSFLRGPLCVIYKFKKLSNILSIFIHFNNLSKYFTISYNNMFQKEKFNPAFSCFKVAALMVFFFMACHTKERSTTIQKTSVRLISYNVWYGFTKLPERKNLWIDWMKDQDPDIVSLQELNEYNPDKLKSDAQKWGHAYTVLLKTEGFPTGVTSRYPIEDVQRTLEGFHHGLLRVKIMDWYVYIIHLHPSNWKTRVREINHILNDISTLPEGSSVILAGDFNTFSPEDSVYYSQSSLVPFFKKRDLEFNENKTVDIINRKTCYRPLGK